MTIAEAIRRCDELLPNRFKLEQKVKWIARVEGELYRDIIATHANPGIKPPIINEDTDCDTQLIAQEPYDELYVLYLQAMIHYENMEIMKYNNAKTLYNDTRLSFRDWWNRHFLPDRRVPTYQFGKPLPNMPGQHHHHHHMPVPHPPTPEDVRAAILAANKAKEEAREAIDRLNRLVATGELIELTDEKIGDIMGYTPDDLKQAMMLATEATDDAIDATNKINHILDQQEWATLTSEKIKAVLGYTPADIDLALSSKGKLAGGSDLNDIIDSGIYVLTNGATYINKPDDITDGVLIVAGAYNSNAYHAQIIVYGDTANIAYRYKRVRDWSEWNVTNDLNIDKITEVLGYEPADAANVPTIDEFNETKEAFNQLENVVNHLSDVVLNGYEESNYIDGKNLDKTGDVIDADGISLTDYIPITYGIGNARYYYNEIVGGYKYKIAFYDANKTLTGAVQSSSSNAEYRTLSAPSDAMYVRFSFRSGTTAKITNHANPPTITFFETQTISEQSIEERLSTVETVTERIKGSTPYIVAKSDNLLSGQQMVACSNVDIKKDDITTFWCNVNADSFGSVTIGHGYKINYGAVVTVDSINVTTFYGTSQYLQKPHGLTIDRFLCVEIIHSTNARATIRLTTASGQFEIASSAVAWGGCKGDVVAVCESGRVSNCILTVTFCDFTNDLYMCGDSYTSFGDKSRYPMYLMDNGYNKISICGFGGATSADQIKCFRQMVELGRPKFFIWALGMNDADTASAVNASWKTFADEFIATCESKGIIPILATIPNVPSRNQMFKNDIVRNSGYRYIDFAKAVGAEEIASSWFDGLLSSDNVHPTELGAKALYARFVTDVPEIMY